MFGATLEETTGEKLRVEPAPRAAMLAPAPSGVVLALTVRTTTCVVAAVIVPGAVEALVAEGACQGRR